MKLTIKQLKSLIETKIKPTEPAVVGKRIRDVLIQFLTVGKWFDVAVEQQSGIMGFAITGESPLSLEDVSNGILELLSLCIKVHPKGISINLSRVEFYLGLRRFDELSEFHDDLRNHMQIVERYGWHLLISDGSKWSIAPNYTTRISNEQLPRYVYHLTPHENVEKILKTGLTPKSPRKVDGHVQRTYQPRVYVLLDPELIDELIMGFQGSQIGNAMMSGGTVYSAYSVIKIDTLKLPKSVKFFEDLELHGSAWTYNQIPPECLEIDVDHKSPDDFDVE